MNFTMCVMLFMGILLSSMNVSEQFSTSISIGFHDAEAQPFDTDGPATIDCICEGTQRSENLTDVHLVQAIFSSVNNHRDCPPDIPHKICWMVESCEECVAEKIQCLPETSNLTGDASCFNYSLEIKDNMFASYRHDSSSRNPVKELFHNSIECPYPSYPRTYVYDTLEYVNLTWAEMQCAYGYTLSDGIARELECSYNSGTWKPKEFEECQPFVDCSVQLKGPGKVLCSHGDSVRIIPSCQVWCYDQENITETEPSEHVCHIEKGWIPQLPSCADTDRQSDIQLVPAPEIKVHTLRLEPHEKCDPQCKTVQSKKKDLSQTYFFNWFLKHGHIIQDY